MHLPACSRQGNKASGPSFRTVCTPTGRGPTSLFRKEHGCWDPALIRLWNVRTATNTKFTFDP